MPNVITWVPKRGPCATSTRREVKIVHLWWECEPQYLRSSLIRWNVWNGGGRYQITIWRVGSVYPSLPVVLDSMLVFSCLLPPSNDSKLTLLRIQNQSFTSSCCVLTFVCEFYPNRRLEIQCYRFLSGVSLTYCTAYTVHLSLWSVWAEHIIPKKPRVYIRSKLHNLVF